MASRERRSRDPVSCPGRSVRLVEEGLDMLADLLVFASLWSRVSSRRSSLACSAVSATCAATVSTSTSSAITAFFPSVSSPDAGVERV